MRSPKRRRARVTATTLHLTWGRLHVWRYGTGPRVILAVHGLGGSGRYWEGLAHVLGDDFTVVAPDLGGFGRSDKPALTYDHGFHVAAAEAVAAEVGSARLDVVGHSLGGVIAALWAARHPARIHTLALVAAPFPQPATPQRRLHETANLSKARGRTVAYRALQLTWPALSHLVRSPTYPHAVVRDYLRATRLSYWGTLHGVLRDPAVPRELRDLGALRTTPCLLLSSPEDRTADPPSAQAWASCMPWAEQRIEGGGHQLLLRSHFAALAEWLRAHSGD